MPNTETSATGIQGGPSRITSIALCLLALSALTNVMLALRLQRTRRLLAAIAHESMLSVGDRVPSETLKGLDGRSLSLTYSASSPPTILYVMKPDCAWCERNSGALAALWNETKGRYRLVAVSLAAQASDIENYVHAHHVAYPIYMASEAFARDYKASQTPTTIVVGGDGRVLRVWAGAYIGPIAAEVERYFNIHLPRLPTGTPCGQSPSEQPGATAGPCRG